MKTSPRTKLLSFAALVPLFAALNRIWGGEPVLGMSGRKIVILTLLPLSAAAWWLLEDKVLAVLMITWAIGRSIAYKATGGSLTPTTTRELVGSALRFSIPMWGAGIATLQWGWAAGAYFYALMLYVPAATALSYYYGQVVERLKELNLPETGENTKIELGHGALYGLALLLGHVSQQLMH